MTRITLKEDIYFFIGHNFTGMALYTTPQYLLTNSRNGYFQIFDSPLSFLILSRQVLLHSPFPITFFLLILFNHAVLKFELPVRSRIISSPKFTQKLSKNCSHPPHWAPCPSYSHCNWSDTWSTDWSSGRDSSLPSRCQELPPPQALPPRPRPPSGG